MNSFGTPLSYINTLAVSSKNPVFKYVLTPSTIASANDLGLGFVWGINRNKIEV
jgi:hypothetical protein